MFVPSIATRKSGAGPNFSRLNKNGSVNLCQIKSCQPIFASKRPVLHSESEGGSEDPREYAPLAKNRGPIFSPKTAFRNNFLKKISLFCDFFLTFIAFMRYYIIEMPRTELIIYKDKDESVPLLKWMNSFSREVQSKWTARFDLLGQFGFELRRPFCDILRDGIYELRLKIGTINYRVLYAFVGKNVVLLSHGFSKKDIVPDTEIDKAIANRNKYLANPPVHTLKM